MLRSHPKRDAVPDEFHDLEIMHKKFLETFKAQVDNDKKLFNEQEEIAKRKIIWKRYAEAEWSCVLFGIWVKEISERETLRRSRQRNNNAWLLFEYLALCVFVVIEADSLIGIPLCVFMLGVLWTPVEYYIPYKSEKIENLSRALETPLANIKRVLVTQEAPAENIQKIKIYLSEIARLLEAHNFSTSEQERKERGTFNDYPTQATCATTSRG